MVFDSLELRLLVSAAAVLGTALIALIVDYLKGHNERLREGNLELSIRREEEGRRSLLEIRLLREQMAAAARPGEPAPPREGPAAEDAAEPASAAVVQVIPVEEPRAEVPQPEAEVLPPPADAGPRISISSGLEPRKEPARPLKPVLVEFQPEWPRGLVDFREASRLLAGDPRLTGVVVAVGIVDAGEPAALMQNLVRSLIGPDDVAWQQETGDAIIVCPNASGAEAQKRIHAVAEKLWDYQLRLLSASSVLVSWGALTVSQEPLSEAVSLALEEMNQTRDSRRGAGLSAVRPRGQAAGF